MIKHIGNLIIEKGDTRDFSHLEEVTGYLYISSGVTLPKLTSVGGYLYIYSNSKINIPFTKGKKYRAIDRCLFIIESEKTSRGIKILSGYNVKGLIKSAPSKEQCFVAEKDGFAAHGNTVKKAIQDVQFKAVAEQLKKEPIKADTLITIQYYRIITGACEMGCKSFIDAHKLKYEYKAKDLLPILETHRAYGLESFKKLISF